MKKTIIIAEGGVNHNGKILINKKMKKQKCAYKSKNVSNKIINIIEKINMSNLNLKKFYDI